jgi:hypothetical protein
MTIQRLRTLVVLLFLAATSAVWPQAPKPHSKVTPVSLDTLIQLETQVWEALRTGDAAADGRLLAESFLGVYERGFAGKADHSGQLAEGPTVAAYQILEPRCVLLPPDAALLSYKATWTRLQKGVRGATETLYVTSIWQRTNGQWHNLFSQDTRAAK